MIAPMVVTHNWEHRAGVKAPFRFVGFWQMPSASLAEHNTEAYNNAMSSAPACCNGSCAVCGMGIMAHYILADAAGVKFAVGCDCVTRMDDSRLITAVQAHKNKLARDAAALKRQALRDAEHAAAMVRLEEQRALNGGFTDYEVEQKAKADALEITRDANRAKFARLLDALESSGGGFCESIALEVLNYGQLPSGRARPICADIFAKFHGGRRGSKAYQAARVEFDSLYLEVVPS